MEKIKKYKDDSYNRSFYHSKAYSYMSNKNNILSIFNIGLISITGVITSVFTIIGKENIFFGVLVSSVLYLSLFVSGIQKFLNYEVLSAEHNSSSLGFSLLYKNLRDFKPDENENYLITQFHLLESSSPSIPDFISKIVPPEQEKDKDKEEIVDIEIDKLHEIRMFDLERLKDLV